MKKALALVLALGLAASLAACSGTPGGEISTTPPASQENSETQEPRMSGPPSIPVTAPESDSVPAAQDASFGEPETISPFSNILPDTWQGNIYAWAPGGNFDVHIPPAPEDAGTDITITAEQQNNIIAQLQEIAEKYASGEYPLTTADGTDYTPYSQQWPANAPMEITVQPNGIFYCSTTNVMYLNVGVYFMLDANWLMCASVIPGGNPDNGTVADAAAENYWYVHPEYTFMKS